MQLPYPNRALAGRALADALQHYAGRPDLLIFALPRGGVPVGLEIVAALHAPLDVLLVRKLGVPGHEELAFGAIALGGIRVLNHELISVLGLSDHVIDEVTRAETVELRRREQAYRDDRQPPEVAGRCVILIDDGLATGASVRAGVAVLRQQHAERIVVAVPVAPFDTVLALRAEADDVVCPATPEPFVGVGRWYEDFRQTSDDEVRALLRAAWARQPNPAVLGRVAPA